MPIQLGCIIFIVVIVIIIFTRKARKQYNSQPVTYGLIVVFKKEPVGLKDNYELKKVGYWYEDNPRTFRVESHIKVDKVKDLLLKELNLTEKDFTIRDITDCFIPQARL